MTQNTIHEKIRFAGTDHADRMARMRDLPLNETPLLQWHDGRFTGGDGNAQKVYVCGPMTGHENFNRDNFERVTRGLKAYGFLVISPVELDDADGISYDPGAHDAEEWAVSDGTYRKLLLRDVTAILEQEADGIVVLDGWEQSRGAALEVHVARSVGLPIYDEHGQVVKAPTEYKPPSDETVAETAQRLVGGDRGEQYGHPIDDFGRTAGVINALFGTEFAARDIPILMIAVKLSRIIESPTKRDSIVDIIGYALTREMVAEKEGAPLA